MAQTDEDLVKATLGGDPQAFEAIVERYQSLAFNIIYHYIGYRDEVEDLAPAQRRTCADCSRSYSNTKA